MFLRLTLVQVGAAVLVFLILFLLIRREDGLHLRLRGEFEQLMAQDWDIAGLFGGEARSAFSAGQETDGVRLPGAAAPKEDGTADESAAVILTADRRESTRTDARTSSAGKDSGNGGQLSGAATAKEGGTADDDAAVILTADRRESTRTAARTSSAGKDGGSGVLLLAAAGAAPSPAEGSLLTESFYGDDAPVLPVNGPVTSDYGERIHPITGVESFHSGRDIAAAEGTGISAVYDGTVTDVGVGELSGNYVKIDHGDGLTALYCHCSEVYAEEGDAVRKGDIIAAVGQTGAATGPHLHFEIRIDGELRDPAAVLDAAENVD